MIELKLMQNCDDSLVYVMGLSVNFIFELRCWLNSFLRWFWSCLGVLRFRFSIGIQTIARGMQFVTQLLLVLSTELLKPSKTVGLWSRASRRSYGADGTTHSRRAEIRQGWKIKWEDLGQWSSLSTSVSSFVMMKVSKKCFKLLLKHLVQPGDAGRWPTSRSHWLQSRIRTRDGQTAELRFSQLDHSTTRPIHRIGVYVRRWIRAPVSLLRSQNTPIDTENGFVTHDWSLG